MRQAALLVVDAEHAGMPDHELREVRHAYAARFDHNTTTEDNGVTRTRRRFRAVDALPGQPAQLSGPPRATSVDGQTPKRGIDRNLGRASCLSLPARHDFPDSALYGGPRTLPRR